MQRKLVDENQEDDGVPVSTTRTRLVPGNGITAPMIVTLCAPVLATFVPFVLLILKAVSNVTPFNSDPSHCWHVTAVVAAGMIPALNFDGTDDAEAHVVDWLPVLLTLVVPLASHSETALSTVTLTVPVLGKLDRKILLGVGLSLLSANVTVSPS